MRLSWDAPLCIGQAITMGGQDGRDLGLRWQTQHRLSLPPSATAVPMTVVTLDTAEASARMRKGKANVLPHALPLCKHLKARDCLIQRPRGKLAWLWLPRLFVQVLRPHYQEDPLHLLLGPNLWALVGQPVERGHILNKSDMSYNIAHLYLKGQDLSNQENPRASTFCCLFLHPCGVPQREELKKPGLQVWIQRPYWWNHRSPAHKPPLGVLSRGRKERD